ncbi:hypothetical protein PCANC_12022 [Puccinia coronata f. sp. avenae]|uniref:Uncharacterized protein n=1 Tax=Puccinia coronata f. sp. avenae TaxID=200324 RepID=A0A2N5UUG7_9BASI|nr:hypothetical protein PCASD_14860 [Puccinia coronata f. sp. avenae]PLW41400.1 hypothetical protein PCANC_12022 [Puccinia coronata f. sp. avenae]
MRSFLTVAVSLACIQAISAVPVYNLGGDKLHARQMTCNNMSGGLLGLNLLGSSTCMGTGGGSSAPAGGMPVPTGGAGLPGPMVGGGACTGMGGAGMGGGRVAGPTGGSFGPSGGAGGGGSYSFTHHTHCFLAHSTKRLRDTDGRNETSKLNLKFFI